MLNSADSCFVLNIALSTFFCAHQALYMEVFHSQCTPASILTAEVDALSETLKIT